MWPNQFATMLIDLSGASSTNAVGLATITAIVIYFAAVGGVSLLATVGIWEILDRRENNKRG